MSLKIVLKLIGPLENLNRYRTFPNVYDFNITPIKYSIEPNIIINAKMHGYLKFLNHCNLFANYCSFLYSAVQVHISSIIVLYL